MLVNGIDRNPGNARVQPSWQLTAGPLIAAMMGFVTDAKPVHKFSR